jgi:NADPH:quinone reductase-like Zn-dependent oxidoreductase
MQVEANSRAENDKTVSRALWFEAAGVAAMREVPLGPLAPGHARVRTLWSMISRGTERLVFNGEVPASVAAEMRAPLQQGDFGFPVKYGYCAVGRVEAGPAEWLDKCVFALHPHQDVFDAPPAMLSEIPANIPPRRATLAANMETALNALWDSGAGPGDRIAVVGAGVIGLLVAALAARLPGAEVTVIDVAEERRGVAENNGARFHAAGEAAGMGADIVFHTSASSAGLATALACAGFEAMLVEMSWYGARGVTAPLGDGFHSRRLRLVSSQVGQVSPSRRPRWSHARRLAKAIELLDDARLDALITDEVAFTDLAARMPAILAPGAPGLATVVRH